MDYKYSIWYEHPVFDRRLLVRKTAEDFFHFSTVDAKFGLDFSPCNLGRNQVSSAI